jgi:hypothetical protein
MSSASDETSEVQDRMMGSVPGATALGRGPVLDGGFSRHEYDHPGPQGRTRPASRWTLRMSSPGASRPERFRPKPFEDHDNNGRGTVCRPGSTHHGSFG